MGVLNVVLCVCLAGVAAGQRPQTPVQKIGDGVYRIGAIRVDTKKREVSVTGVINDATTLEWVANTQSGGKAYESAMTLDTDGVTFNTALLLIGLDVKHARVPEFHFDPKPPQGDPVDMFVTWGEGAAAKRVGIEQLLYDQRTRAPLPAGGWVYTGSMMLESNQYRADADGGVLIGFVHSPAPVIENRNPGAVSAFGSVILNRNIGLGPDTRVTLTIVAKPAPGAKSGS
jgi:hypothetical protein